MNVSHLVTIGQLLSSLRLDGRVWDVSWPFIYFINKRPADRRSTNIKIKEIFINYELLSPYMNVNWFYINIFS